MSVKSPNRNLLIWNNIKASCFLLCLLAGYITYGQNFSAVSGHGIPALTNAKAEWVDFNNDNVLDLFISGINSVGGLNTTVYLNNGNNTFNAIGLTGLADIAYDFADYNADGYVDILLTGINSSATKKTILYRNNAGTAFISEATSLPPLSKGAVLWEDLDHDTDFDLVLTGLNSSNKEITLLYKYHDSQFIPVSHTIQPVSNGTLVALDANNDGNTEVVVTGMNSAGSPVANIYTFYANFSYTGYSQTLAGFAFNSISTTDYNEDSFGDVIATGLAGETLDKRTSLLQNNHVNDFTTVSTIFKNLSSSSIDHADLNNDGRSDFILSGIDNASLKYFKYYQNTAGHAFNDISHSLPNLYNGDAALADYDNDGDIDIFQIGNSDISFQSNLYKSDQAATAANSAPAIPTNLHATVVNDSVYFSWSAATDDHTNANSLTYNIYISASPNGANLVLNPLSDVISGYRRIILPGNAGYKTSIAFHDLPEGRYYWSVQSIDNNFAASDFATEGSFAVCYPISLGADTTICKNDVLKISIGNNDDVVNWYSKTTGLLASNTFNLQHGILNNDTIVAELTKSYTCTVKDTLIVKMSVPPSIDLGANTGVCSGQQFSVTLPGSDSVNWYNPNESLLKDSHSYQYTVTAKDTIIAEVFNVYKCVSHDTLVVDVLPLPSFTIGNDRSICFEETTLFQATGTWQSVTWRSTTFGALSSTSNQLNYEVTVKDTIIARTQDGNGCVNYDSAITEVLPLPVISLGNDKHVCFEQMVTLNLTGSGADIKWLDEDDNVLASNVSSYSYQVLIDKRTFIKVTDGNNCINYDSIDVNVLALPDFNVGRDTSVCDGNNILLEAGAGFTRVDWISKTSGGVIQPDSWFFNYLVVASDTLIAKAENNNGCINYDSIKIDMLPLPDFTLGEDQIVCYQDTIDLAVDGTWDEVNWYTENDIILQPDSPTYSYRVENDVTLWAEVYSTDRCVSYDTLLVSLRLLPEFSLGDDRSYCIGDQIDLSVPNVAVDYKWTNETGDILSNTSQYHATASQTTIVYLTVADELACRFKDDVNITVNGLPQFSVTGNPEICASDTAMLFINYANWQSINWKNVNDQSVLSDSDSLTISLSSTLTINVILTDSNSCISEKQFDITVHERPVANAGDNALLCFGESATLGTTPANGNKYSWFPAAFLSDSSSPIPVTSPEHTINYVLTVTNTHDCSSVDSVLVEVNPEIMVDAGANTAICIGGSIVLGGKPTASGSAFPYVYQWLAGDETLNVESANPEVAPVGSTRYYVLVTSGKCSVEIDSIDIVVNPLPEITVSDDQTIGAGSSVPLTATGGVTFLWTPAETLSDGSSQTPLASPLKTTIYTVKVTDANQCSDTASVKVYVQNVLFIPNVFSPNGDEQNDEFKIYGSGIETMVLSIFDQKGNEVFRSSDKELIFESGWDGTHNGKLLKNDVYIWTIEGRFYNGEAISFEGKNNGVVKLMR